LTRLGAAAGLPTTERFEIVRRIGSGGMGVVYEAFDRQRSVSVALKMIRKFTPETLLRFKNEFRLVQDLRHPNLIALEELHLEKGQCFFTMELIRGVSLLRFLRPHDGGEDSDDGSSVSNDGYDPPPRAGASRDGGARPVVTNAGGFVEPRLRAAFAQLASGLSFLHRASRIHRDIKPSNILVDEHGRLVLLDFGLVAAVSNNPSIGRYFVGTEAYVAPEQADWKKIGPEADWYSVGVVLYQALTGVLPFVGKPQRMLELKQLGKPIAPCELVPEIPPDLDELCCRLLEIDPARRPSAARVLAAFGVDAEEELRAAHTTTVFVGRDAELEALRTAFKDMCAGHPSTVLIHGDSGIGKSALVDRFAGELRDSSLRTLVLRGRCSQQESVPYKALDGVIDELSRALIRLGDEIELPPGSSVLSQLFPVLSRVPRLARAEDQRTMEPQALRRLAFASLRELLRRVAEQSRLVIIIENLQWADPDGMALLLEIIHPFDGPCALVIATLRSDGADVPGLIERLASSRARVLPLHLQPLAKEDSLALAAALLPSSSPDLAEALAEDAGGHPLFIAELARGRRSGAQKGTTSASLDDVLWERARSLDEQARRLIELVAVAGHPVSRDVAAGATSLGLGTLGAVIAQLKSANLVRLAGTAPADVLEPFHARVQEALVARLSLGERRELHRRIASAMELADEQEAEALSVHWEAAGDRAKAARYAFLAAKQAEAALAFNRAASFYNSVILLHPDRKDVAELRRQHAQALANAGRGGEAGQAFLRCAAAAQGDESLEHRRRAADQLLRAGYTDAGLEALRGVLDDLGIPSSKRPRAALRTIIWGRVRLRLRGFQFRERAEKDIPKRELMRLDACTTAANMLGVIDTIRGAEFQSRNIHLALDAGEPSRVAVALTMEAAFSAAGGARTSARTAKILTAARTIADRIDIPYVQARVIATDGLSAFLEGRWMTAWEQCNRAETIFREQCTGVNWERGAMQLFSLNALSYLGRIKELVERAPRWLHEAEQHGDLFTATNLSTGYINIAWLADGNPAVARRFTTEALKKWSRSGWHLEHYYDLVAQCNIDLYEGANLGAFERIETRWPTIEQSLQLHVQLIRANLHSLWARAALAAGVTVGDDDLLKKALRHARALEREHVEWARALALLARAGVAGTRGEGDKALHYLDECIAAFERQSMGIHAAVSRRRKGMLLGPHTGAMLVDDADEWMRRQGIREPLRFMAMLAPGFSS
jgi:eukaryotic-like serine/threonine-protein kinase